jgi:hypothetical protein
MQALYERPRLAVTSAPAESLQRTPLGCPRKGWCPSVTEATVRLKRPITEEPPKQHQPAGPSGWGEARLVVDGAASSSPVLMTVRGARLYLAFGARNHRPKEGVLMGETELTSDREIASTRGATRGFLSDHGDRLLLTVGYRFGGCRGRPVGPPQYGPLNKTRVAASKMLAPTMPGS